METTFENVVTDDAPQNQVDEPQDRPKKKKPSPMRAIKVALLRMGKKRSSESPKKSPPVDIDNNGSKSKSSWKNLVGSMRPMHLQETQTPRSSSSHKSNDGDLQQQIFDPTSLSDYSTDGGDGWEYSPSPASSKYASAVGLNEMVRGDEEEEEGESKQESDGDEMIDAKADEFIAKFYTQMKLQRMDTMDRLCNERYQRSLGW